MIHIERINASPDEALHRGDGSQRVLSWSVSIHLVVTGPEDYATVVADIERRLTS